MANNNLQKSRILRCSALLYLLIFVFIGVQAKGQHLKKYYTSLLQEKGTLYFIDPILTFHGKQKDAYLNLDITYLSSKDSLTVNFTYKDDSIRKLKQISFSGEGENGNKIFLKSNCSMIYIDAEKKIWKHRYTSDFKFTDFVRLFDTSKYLEVTVYYDTGKSNLRIKKKDWKKYRVIIQKIFKVIALNS
ncbi:MAG: hypothetical protein ACEPOW_01125 [Bacteroidales bacterium]